MDIIDAGAFANPVVFPAVGFVFGPYVFSVNVSMCFTHMGLGLTPRYQWCSICLLCNNSLMFIHCSNIQKEEKNLTLKDFTQLKHILCLLQGVILNYGLLTVSVY